MTDYSQSLDQFRTPFLSPDLLSLDIVGIVKFCCSFSFLANDNGSHTSTFKGSRGEETNTTVSSRSKVDGVSSSRWEVAAFYPVDGSGEDLITQ